MLDRDLRMQIVLKHWPAVAKQQCRKSVERIHSRLQSGLGAVRRLLPGAHRSECSQLPRRRKLKSNLASRAHGHCGFSETSSNVVTAITKAHAVAQRQLIIVRHSNATKNGAAGA